MQPTPTAARKKYWSAFHSKSLPAEPPDGSTSTDTIRRARYNPIRSTDPAATRHDNPDRRDNKRVAARASAKVRASRHTRPQSLARASSTAPPSLRHRQTFVWIENVVSYDGILRSDPQKVYSREMISHADWWNPAVMGTSPPAWSIRTLERICDQARNFSSDAMDCTICDQGTFMIDEFITR